MASASDSLRVAPCRGSRGKAQSAPKAQLQVIYLDDDLWVHRTGEGNLFVQQRISPADAESGG